MERFKYIEDPSQKLFVDSLLKQLADAQATIAALQAQVKECDAVIEKQVAILEEINKLDAERAAFVVDLKAQLTQHTSELEAANTLLYKKNCALGRAETSINDLQAELERVRAALERIARYGNDGICPFGCDTPHIAQAALTATSQPAPPYKEWCRHPEECAGLASCPRNPTCAD